MKNILLAVSFISILLSCNRNRILRDKIHFNDNTLNVQNSLLRIIPLLKKFPTSNEVNTGYGYSDDKLEINISAVAEKIKDPVEVLYQLSQNEKKEFLKIADYLHSNGIDSGWFDTYLGTWLFEYRSIPEDDSSDVRVISILSKEDLNRNNLKIEILDKKDMIYLLKFK